MNKQKFDKNGKRIVHYKTDYKGVSGKLVVVCKVLNLIKTTS
jgi:hypothetical protein